MERGPNLFYIPKRGWNPRNVNNAIKRLEETGSINRQKGTGSKKSVMNEDLEAEIVDLAQSQEENPGTHLSQRKLAR